jgi:hypothetical protein
MQTIVWDVDDVLNELMRNWFEHKWLPEHKSCSVRYETLIHNPPHELLGVSIEEYLKSLDSFRLSEMGRNLPPSEVVMAWFHRSGHKFRHIALTATPILCAAVSAAWVFDHFGLWIRSFAFVPSKRPTEPEFEYDLTKKDFLSWWRKADIIIDDNSAHIKAAQELGIHSLQVPRPWNSARGTLSDILNALDSL